MATSAARFSLSHPPLVSTYQKPLSWKSTLKVPNLSASYVSLQLNVIKLSDFILSLDISWCSCFECDIANSFVSNFRGPFPILKCMCLGQTCSLLCYLCWNSLKTKYIVKKHISCWSSLEVVITLRSCKSIL